MMKSPTQDLDASMRDGEDEAMAYPTRRLTMIPAKYKLKEERRKILKISITKLRKIEDPESYLCRSVLINNTMRKLQRETREEKLQKQLNYNKAYFLDVPDCHVVNSDSESDESSKHDKLVESSLTNGVSLNEDVVEKIPSIKRCASRKRSLDEDSPISVLLNKHESEMDVSCPEDRLKADVDDIEDCDVHDVLSQLYMPPTPRLLTSIDSDTDDDDLNVVDMDSSYMDEPKADEFPAKKQKLDEDENFLCGDKPVMPERTCSAKEEEDVIELEDEEDIKRRLSQSLSSYRKGDGFFDDTPPVAAMDCDSLYSCGHSSFFSDMQSVTFHNLIASLET